MDPAERVEHLRRARSDYAERTSAFYDEVVEEVARRAASSGSLGKLEVAGLTGWKRLRADTPWMGRLMSLPDAEVRGCTGEAVSRARDESVSAPEAGAAARAVLRSLPGCTFGDALASAICYAAAPERLAVYDRRAHLGLTRLGLQLAGGAQRYQRYLETVDSLREELRGCGYSWSARHVDLALYWLGGPN